MDTEPNRKTSTWTWIAVAGGGLIVLACLCIAAVALAAGIFGFSTSFTARPGGLSVTAIVLPAATATPAGRPTSTPAAGPTARPSRTPVAGGDDAGDFSSELPPRDRYDLAQRFLGVKEAALPEPTVYEVGDVASFWVSNDDTEATHEVQAELAYANDRVYMWVEQGVEYDLDGLRRSADRFAEVTYPTNRSYFGSEPSPGIDGDPRLHILHSTQLGRGVAGYFYSPSSYPLSVVPYSNEKEIFFINIGNTPPGDAYYDSVLAHEFQHMIHWHVDPNEESWMNEGLSEVAAFLNGFGPSGFTPFFLMNPDLQLTAWPEGGGSGANYGAGFLFNAYFLDRFGQDALRALVANPVNGLAGVDATLAEIGAGVSADELFADWTVANLLNDPALDGGRYGYASIPDLMPVAVADSVSGLPFESGWEPVQQYGTDYVELSGEGEATLHFEGATAVRVIPANTSNTDGDPATDDAFVWWSNRGDDSNMTLTRRLDLAGVDSATLEYDVWYHIEELWDFAYVTVSGDGGETWDILATPHTTTEDPHGNSYGPGYTGRSAGRAGASSEGWLHETIDLGGYAGQEILLRFEMLTDDAVNQPGLAVDNICVEAIGWCDDVESGAGGWEARGFVRHDNVLEQAFSVQVVVRGAGGSLDVIPVRLDEANRGEVSVTLGSRPAVLVVSGLTRHTTEPTQYRYRVTPAGS